MATKTTTTSRSNPTYDLAIYFYSEILGKDESSASKDPLFRRYLSHAKAALKDEAEPAVLRLALAELKTDLIRKHKQPYSIQQVLDPRWHKPDGKSYYEWAIDFTEQQDQPPPVWDYFARLEWETRKELLDGEVSCQ